MREIKFRLWDGTEILNEAVVLSTQGVTVRHMGGVRTPEATMLGNNKKYIYMQYIGLKDKHGDTEVYEGDIIDDNGYITGNIYEIQPRTTDLVIDGMGTSTWRDTESAAISRGFHYAK